MSAPAARDSGAAPAAAIAATLALMAYVATLPSTVGAEDVAEFQTIAAVGGVPHAGYPLQVLLLRIAGSLPLGTMAWRANLVSALATAAAAGAVAWLVARLGARPWAGVAAALAWALSLGPWRDAVRAEVYATSCLTQALAFVALAGLLERPAAAAPYLRAGAALGLAWLGHLGALALALPAAVATLAPTGSRPRLQRALLLIGGLAIGLLPLALLPVWDVREHEMNALRDELQPEMPWGEVTARPPGDPARSAWLVSGRMFLASRYAESLGAGERLGALAADLAVNQLPLLGAPLALLGFAALLRRRRLLAALAAVWLATLAALVARAAYPNVIASFFLPGTWMLAVLAGLGVAAIAARSVRLGAVTAAALALAPLARLAIDAPPAPLARSARLSDAWSEWPHAWSPLRTEFRWERLGRNVMRTLPADAVVVACWDEGTVLRYFRFAARLRDDVDVRFACRTPALLERYAIEAAAAGRPLFATYDPRPQGFAATEVASFPDGALWRVDAWLRGR